MLIICFTVAVVLFWRCAICFVYSVWITFLFAHFVVCSWTVLHQLSFIGSILKRICLNSYFTADWLYKSMYMYFKNCYFSQLSIFKAIKAVFRVTQETNSYLFFALQQQDRWRSSSDDVVPVLLLLSPLAACCCCCCVPLFGRYSLLCIIFLDGVRPGPDSRSGQLLIHPPTRPPPLLLPTCNRCSPPPSSLS